MDCNCTTKLLIAALAIVIPVYYLYYHHKKWSKVNKWLEQFPSPPRVLLLGNVLDFKTPGEFLKKIHEYTRKYGPSINVKIGLRQFLVSSDYKLLEFLLSHNSLLKKTPNLKFLEPWIGTGLVTADGGPKWKIHRKLITPAFHFKILEQFIDVFEADGNILIEKLSKENGSRSMDIYSYITKCTLDAICETAMGTKVDVQNNGASASAYFSSVKEMCRIFAERTTSLLQRYNFYFRFTNNYAIQKKCLEVLHGYTREVIKSKRQELETKSEYNHSDSTDDFGRKKKKAFLDVMLEARVDGQSLTDEEIREEADTFMFAGHDTTATATTFILFCIANNKEVQDKIIEEQEHIFGKEKNPVVSYANLQEMKYLENVVKEGLRLYSPVPLFGRMIDQDVQYNGGVIPKGVGVMVFVHGMHMNPDFYPNPEIFDPTRFDVVANKNPFSFIPFSAGPRNCIGQKYAMLEIKSLVSKIVRNFELLPAIPEHIMDLSPDTVLKSLNGVRIGIKLR